MKTSRKRILSFLLSIVLFVAALIFFDYFIIVAYKEINDKRGEVDSKEKLIADYESSINEGKQFLNRYQSVAAAGKIIELIIPSRENLANAVNQLTSLASLNRLKVEQVGSRRLSLRAVDKEVPERLGTLEINLRLSGAYGDFRAFLRNMETNANLMDLVALKISTDTSKLPGQGALTFDLVVHTYYSTKEDNLNQQ